eukprot:2054643-Lingulodinium_polyedra.AAC.1
MIRTLVLALAPHYGPVGPGHTLWPWLVRHAAWLVARFQPGEDKRSAYFRAEGIEYTGRLCEFGET